MVVVRAATQSTQPQPKVKTTNVLLLLDVADVDTSNNISHISPLSTTAAFRDVRIPAAPEAAPLAARPGKVNKSRNPDPLPISNG